MAGEFVDIPDKDAGYIDIPENEIVNIPEEDSGFINIPETPNDVQQKLSWTAAKEPGKVLISNNEYNYLKPLSKEKVGKNTYFAGTARSTGGFLPTSHIDIDEIAKPSSSHPGMFEIDQDKFNLLGVSDDVVAEKYATIAAKAWGDGSPEAIAEVKKMFTADKGLLSQVASGMESGITSKNIGRMISEELLGSKHFPVKDFVSRYSELKSWINSKPKESKIFTLPNSDIEIEVNPGDTEQIVNSKIMNKAMKGDTQKVFETGKNPLAQMIGNVITATPSNLVFKPATALGKAALIGTEELAQAGATTAGMEDPTVKDFFFNLGTSAITIGGAHLVGKGLSTISRNLNDLRLPKREIDLTMPKGIRDVEKLYTEYDPDLVGKGAAEIKPEVMPHAEDIGQALDPSEANLKLIEEANNGIAVEGLRNKLVVEEIGKKQAEKMIETGSGTEAASSNVIARGARLIERATSKVDENGSPILNNTKLFKELIDSDKETASMLANFESGAERAHPLEEYTRQVLRDFAETTAPKSGKLVSEVAAMFPNNPVLKALGDKSDKLLQELFDASEASKVFKSNAKRLEELRKEIAPLISEGDKFVNNVESKLASVDEATKTSLGLKAKEYNALLGEQNNIASEIAHNAQHYQEMTDAVIKSKKYDKSINTATNLIESKDKAGLIDELLPVDAPLFKQSLVDSITNKKPIDINEDNAQVLKPIIKAVKHYNAEINRYTSAMDYVAKAKTGDLVALRRAAYVRDLVTTPELKLDLINNIRETRNDWIKNTPKSWDIVKKQEVFDHYTRDTYNKTLAVLNDPSLSLVDMKDIQTELTIHQYLGEDYLKDYQKRLFDVTGRNVDTEVVVAHFINPTNGYGKNGVLKEAIEFVNDKLQSTTKKSDNYWERFKSNTLFQAPRERQIVNQVFVGMNKMHFSNLIDDHKLGLRTFETFNNKYIAPILNKYKNFFKDDEFNALEKLLAGTNSTNREFISVMDKQGEYSLTWFGNKVKSILEDRAGKDVVIEDVERLCKDFVKGEDTSPSFESPRDLAEHIYNGYFTGTKGPSRANIQAAFELDNIGKKLNHMGHNLQTSIVDANNVKYDAKHSGLLWRENFVLAKNGNTDTVYMDFRETRNYGVESEWGHTLGSSKSGQLRKCDELTLDNAMNFGDRVRNQSKSQVLGGHTLHAKVKLDQYGILTENMGHKYQADFIRRITNPPSPLIDSIMGHTKEYMRQIDQEFAGIKHIGSVYQIFKNSLQLAFNPHTAILLRASGLAGDVTSTALNTATKQGGWGGVKQAVAQIPNIFKSLIEPAIAITKWAMNNPIDIVSGNAVVNKVLNGTMEVKNREKMFVQIEAAYRKKDHWKWVEGWTNKQDAVFAALRNGIKETSEQRITKTVLLNQYGILEKTNEIILNKGIEAGRKYLTSNLKLAGHVEIDRMVQDIAKRGMQSAESILTHMRDLTAGRYGSSALPVGLKEIGAIFPGVSQFASSIGMVAMDLAGAVGGTIDKSKNMVKEVIFKSMGKEMNALPEAARWSALTVGTGLLAVYGAKKLAENGAPDSWVDVVYGREDDNHIQTMIEHIARHGILGGMEFNLDPLTRTAKAGENLVSSWTGTGYNSMSYARLSMGIGAPIKTLQQAWELGGVFRYSLNRDILGNVDDNLNLNVVRDINPELAKKFEADRSNVALQSQVNEAAQFGYKEHGIKMAAKLFETSGAGWIKDYIGSPIGLLDLVSSLQGNFELASAMRQKAMAEKKDPQLNAVIKMYYNMGLGESFERGDFTLFLNQLSNNLSAWNLYDDKAFGTIDARYNELRSPDVLELNKPLLKRDLLKPY